MAVGIGSHLGGVLGGIVEPDMGHVGCGATTSGHDHHGSSRGLSLFEVRVAIVGRPGDGHKHAALADLA